MARITIDEVKKNRLAAMAADERVVSFRDAVGHRRTGSLHLSAFVLSLLVEHGQQHDASTRREEVGDPPRRSEQVEPELEQPVAKRTRRRHPKQVASLCQTLDVREHRSEVAHAELADPLLHLRLQLDRPHDIIDDIRPGALSRSARLHRSGQRARSRSHDRGKPVQSFHSTFIRAYPNVEQR